MAVVVYFGLPSWLAVVFSLGVLLLQFLFGPFVIEWIYKIRWTDPKDVDPALAHFMTHVCTRQNIPVPRFGIIEDGNPNAFTFGHYPGDARVVVTRGLMKLLGPEERQAVVAHELGHIAHWDFVVMTVAQAVPLVLYTLYITTRRFGRSRGGNRGNIAGAAALVGIVSYVAYIISQYIVLLLSRVREYFADEFAGQVTGNPDRLATALVKVAYGLAAAPKDGEAQKDDRKMVAGRALGIFDPKAASALALASAGTGQVSVNVMAEAMKWDLWNPWAMFYELNSSHPLPARRIRALERQTEAHGKLPSFRFRAEQTESYWDEFMEDVGVQFLPLLGFAAGAALAATLYFTVGWTVGGVGLLFIIWGSTWFAQRRFAYPPELDQLHKVRELVGEVKVSAIRPVPGMLKGRVIGRGVPGLFYSEDLVLQDDTGFMVLDYRQPLGILEFFFGWLKADELIGRVGRAEGWYRRAPRPVFELRRLVLDDGQIVTSYYYPFIQAVVYGLLGLGMLGVVIQVVLGLLT
jgi:heat shock protein HtpX